MTALYVVDTNVVVSALLTGKPDSPPLLLLQRMLDGSLRYLLSTELLAEYRAVLLRPKIRSRHQLSEAEVDDLLLELAANGTLREPATKPLSPDPKDAHLLALLEDEPRAVLVSGDELTLGAVQPRGRALTPRELLERL